MSTRNWIRTAFLAVSARQMRTAKSTKRAKKNERQLAKQSPETHLVSSGNSGQPPDRNFCPKRTVVRRFNQIAAVANQAFSLANGHDQFLTVTAVTGAAVPYIDAWRIKKIDIWAWADTAGNHTTVTLSPVGTDLTSNMNNDPEASYNLVARSQSVAKHMCIVPSKFRPLGSWHFTSNTNFAGALFQLNIATATANSRLVVMDITFEAVWNEVGLPLGYGVTTSTTTLGTIGARPILSGFSPVGVNNLG